MPMGIPSRNKSSTQGLAAHQQMIEMKEDKTLTTAGGVYARIPLEQIGKGYRVFGLNDVTIVS
jgi:hypothetical protein